MKTPIRGARRRPMTFSFQPEDLELLSLVTERVQKCVPGATASEAIRTSILLLAAAPDDLLIRASSRLRRVKSGRPPSPDSETLSSVEGVLPDEATTRERLLLLDELTRLQGGPRGDPAIEHRIEQICRYFGMTPIEP